MIMPAINLVEKIDLLPRDALLPILECVSNSVISLNQSSLPIEERKINVEIVRHNDYQDDIFSGVRPIKDVVITDNGIGFTDDNYLSFQTPHSLVLKKFGCLGVGRFTVIAAFRQMKICSNFRLNGGWKYREFNFDVKKEVVQTDYKDSEDQTNKTTVELNNCFNSQIVNQTAVTTKSIAEEIMEHFLIYYLSNSLPDITVSESDGSAKQNVNELYKDVAKDRERNFEVARQDFKLYITKHPKTTNRRNHYVYYCADSRVVGKSKPLSKLDSLFVYPLSNKSNESYLDVYVVSPYLDKKKTDTRNAFRIPLTNDSLFEGEISFKEIEDEMVKVLKEEYHDYVKKTQEVSLTDWKKFMAANPRFNSLTNDLNVMNTLPPNTPDDKKEEILHRIVYEKQIKVEKKIQEFIETKQVNEESIQAIIEDFRTKTVLDSDSLADYMIRRKAVISLFQRFLEADIDGQYKLESDIHNLIFPMGTTSNEIGYESHNLWLLDERFLTYKFIGSDKAITSFSQIKSSKEPDLTCLMNEPQIRLKENPPMFDNPIGFGDKSSGDVNSLVIFEFKRPGDTAHQKNKTDYRWQFSELVEPYFDDFLYSPDKKNYKGKQVVVKKETPKFGFIILDVIPPLLEQYNLDKGWKKTPFGTYYKIEGEINLHLEVMTFNKLLEFAEERHNPFFDRLFVTRRG